MVGVMVMVMVVDGLLLFAAGQLLGGKSNPLRLILGSFLGAALAAVSLANHWESLWRRILCLFLTAVLTYGFSSKGCLKLLLFCLLHFSLGGLTRNQNEFLHTLLGAAGIGFACLIAGKERTYLPVELTYRGSTLHLTALRDTGNTLRDPITGNAVLIVDAMASEKLTGLEREMLRDPVSAMEKLPGLRLIPYKTVGNSGFLLALLITEAKIGNQQGSAIVAFSPQNFGSKYQALTGGSL